MIIACIIFLIIAIVGLTIYRHQCLLKDRAQMMRAAMRHRDFSFRLPTKGLLFGEKALQEALNDMGQDIQKLVARNEVEAWQRLTRVLTHEIMNATTPIQSISQAYLSHPNIKGSIYEEGIQTIHDTTVGLATFIESYRKLTQLQEPVLRDMNFCELIHSIAALYPDIVWQLDIPSDLTLRADSNLLRQVFINITKNAIEAGAEKIGVKWDGKLYVSNNGHTISDEVAREIFIPFFTTKNTGSGIGLSLSRQILMMQKMILTLAAHPLNGYNVSFVIEMEK